MNQYILMPDQQMVLRDVESRRKRMVSMSQDDRNRLGAGELQEFKDTVHTDSVMMCYTHLNVLAWTSPDKVKEIRGKIVPALGKTMGCVATESYHDLPSLFFAGCPGGACEVGVSNYMLQALKGTLCFGIYEGFEEGLPGGNLLLSDRFRNVPVRLDLGTVAKRYHLIDNYNIFLLGPSGSGKSYFTNFFLRQSYQAGEWNFVIDIGGSYEGLCQIIRELSGGADGAYMSWDENHRISFNPFVGYENWLVDDCLQMEEGGAPFFVSLIKTMWKPKGGWTTDNEAILYSILADFLRWIGPRLKEGALPVFDDFYRFLGKEIQPRIVPKYDKQGNIKAMPSKPYVVAYNPVLLEEFNIVEMLRSLMNYASDGMYGFLLNDPNPADLFSNRFTVFEVKRLSESGDDVFYSVCVLCITGAFDIRMRRGDGFKRLVIDEAWKAIMNETMAPYLRSLWKTARKYSTSAMVVTQELDDIRSSEVIRNTIIGNSDIKILLNQQKNAEKFDVLQEVMSLNDHQKHLILSMMKGHDPRLPYHTDVYIGYLNRYGVFSVEGSAQEAKAYESEFEAKRPVFEKAKQVGSMVRAIEEITGFVDKCEDYEEKGS